MSPSPFSDLCYPSAQTRQPVVGDKVKMYCHGAMVEKTWAGSPTVQLVDKIEYQ